MSWVSKGQLLGYGVPEHSWMMGMVYRSSSGKVRTIQSGLYFVQDSWINLPQSYCRESCDYLCSLPSVSFYKLLSDRPLPASE